MKTYICEICGDAYLGDDKPSQCPFCGAEKVYIKDGNLADPVVNQNIRPSSVSLENLKETLKLETKASAIYACMANNADSYEVKAMFKRLSKVELEHANIVCKIMKIQVPEISSESCSEDDIENFKATIKLEEHASELYHSFVKTSEEESIRKIFAALAEVEEGHIELAKKYL